MPDRSTTARAGAETRGRRATPPREAIVAALCILALIAATAGCSSSESRASDGSVGGSELTIGHEILNVVTFPFRMIGYGLYYSLKFVFWDIWSGLFLLLFPPAESGTEDFDIGRLSSRDKGERIAATMSLGMAKCARAAPEILKLLTDPEEDVRAAAGMSLSMIRDPSITADLARLSRSSGDERVRASSVRVMGFAGHPDAAFAVTSALDDDSWMVRAEAAVAAGRLGSWNAGPRVISALKDPDPRVRGAAAIGLSYMGDRRALPALRDLFDRLAGEGTFVRAAAITALADLSDQSMTRRFTAIARGEGPLRDTYSKAAATWGLGKLGAAETRPLLRSILLDGSSELPSAEAAAQALGMLGDAEAIAAAAASEDVIVRLAAVLGLIEIGGDSAAAGLAALTSDSYSDVRQRAIVSLLQMGRREAVPRMIDQLGSPDVEIRAWAYVELKRISGKDLGLEPKGWLEWWEDNSGTWDPGLYYSRIGKPGRR